MKYVKQISSRSLTFNEFHSRMAKPISAKAVGALIVTKRRIFKVNGETIFTMRSMDKTNGKLVRKVTSAGRHRTKETKVFRDQRVVSFY